MLSFCVPSNLRSENAGSKTLHIWNSFGLLYQGAEKICFSFCAQNAQVKPVAFPAHKQSIVQVDKKRCVQRQTGPPQPLAVPLFGKRTPLYTQISQCSL